MMKTKTSMDLNGSLAVGGGLLAGLGAGFFFLETNALYFVGSLLAGLGVGLILAAILGGGKAIQIEAGDLRSKN